MNLRQRIAGAWDAIKGRAPGTPITSDNALYIADTVTYNDEARSRTHQGWGNDLAYIQRAVVGTLWAACAMNATVCGSQPLRLYTKARGKPKGYSYAKIGNKRLDYLRGQKDTRPHRKTIQYATETEELVEVTDHPICTLLSDPDPNLPGVDTLRMWFMFKEMTGRCYGWMADRVAGAPTSIYTMWPQFVAPMADKKNFIYAFWYGRERTEGREYPAEDVLYLREWVDPANPLEAMSWVHSVTINGDLENAALTAEVNRWKNGGMPSIVFVDETGKLHGDQLKQARTDIENQIRGVNKAGSFLVTKLLKPQPAIARPHEMNFEAGLEDARAAIWLAAGIPETLRHMDSSNRASAAVGNPTYTGLTISPKLNKLESELNERLLPEFGLERGEYFLAFDNPTREDNSEDKKNAIAGFAAGLYTRNQALQKGGDDPIEGPEGEEYAAAGQQQAQDTAGDTAGGKPPQGKTFRHGKGCACCTKSGNGKGPIDTRAELPDDSIPAIDASRADIEPWYERTMKAIADGWAAGHLAEDTPAVPGHIVATVPHRIELTKILQPHIESAYKIGTRQAAELVVEAEYAPSVQGVLAALPNDAALHFARARSLDMGIKITDTMGQLIRSIVEQGIEDGSPVSVIHRTLTEEIPGLSSWKAEQIAIYEYTWANGKARGETMREAGVETKVWKGTRICPICSYISWRDPEGGADGDEVAVSMDEPFVFAGTTIEYMGENGKPESYTFDEDVMDGPAHPYCGCYVEPVGKD